MYNGYHLPTGSIVMANIWSILRDPLVFPNPREFEPERFMDDKIAVDTVGCIFGFGRRYASFNLRELFLILGQGLSGCSLRRGLDVHSHCNYSISMQHFGPFQRSRGTNTPTCRIPDWDYQVFASRPVRPLLISRVAILKNSAALSSPGFGIQWDNADVLIT